MKKVKCKLISIDLIHDRWRALVVPLEAHHRLGTSAIGHRVRTSVISHVSFKDCILVTMNTIYDFGEKS